MLNRVSILLCIIFLLLSCTQSDLESQKQRTQDTISVDVQKGDMSENENKSAVDSEGDIKVTFIEFGSKGCVPCKMMEPVMEEIREEYAGQVKVIFHDAKTQEGRVYAKQFNIRVIPTQVFLDSNGEEYFRHEGFFPKEEVVKILLRKGVTQL